MTVQEALARSKGTLEKYEQFFEHGETFLQDEIDYWRTVVDALEKRIRMRPLHAHKNYYCPVCKEDGWVIWDDAVPNEFDAFCGRCGQRIDWSEGDENERM